MTDTISIFDDEDENANAQTVMEATLARELDGSFTETPAEWVARNVALVGEEEAKRRLRAKVARHGGG